MIDRMMKAMGIDIFERRTPDEPHGYKLVLPGVMVSADEVQVSFADGVYTASYTEDGRTYTGTAEYDQAAMLAMIADRMGFRATIVPNDELEDQHG